MDPMLCRCCYCLAASVMYEQALRCESSEAQWKCFSISYNALKLLKQEDAFIVRPSLSSIHSVS